MTKHSSAKAPDISMNQAVYEGNIEIIKQHLSFGADINTKDAGGWSPLHWAVGEGHEKTIKLLLGKKADVNAIDQTGKTPLDYALINKKKETADLLRVYGAKAAKELKKNEIKGHKKKSPEGNIDNNIEKLENELHHLRQEIEDFREAGKLERVKKLKHQEKAVLVEIEKYSNEENKPQIDELDFEERFKTTIEKRHEAISKFEELSKALEQLETQGNKSEIDNDQLEKKLDEAEYNVEKFTKELERLEQLFGD
ncbi:ankyrin repeat domain-containing protein [Verrucomicrobia bacterium]|nr:ankyrin repeat domain-containing protein [Verrucomicrobiota bacterium]